MGIGFSSQLPPPGAGHHPLFYKGVTALSAGRYTLSETFFHQALHRHPGRDFWDEVLSSAQPPRRKHQSTFDESHGESTLRGPQGLIKEILLPLDDRFVELHDFARLVADVALNYYYQAVSLGNHPEADMVRRVGMMYSGYLAMRMQAGMLMLHVMLAECTEARVAADAMAEAAEAQAEPSPRRSHRSTRVNMGGDVTAGPSEAGKPQFSPTNPPPPELLIKILSLKEKCVTTWISSVFSFASAALHCSLLIPTTTEGDLERKRVIAMAWDCVDLILSVLRNVASVYKNLTTASIFEAHLEQMRASMLAVGMGTEGYTEGNDPPSPTSKGDRKSMSKGDQKSMSHTLGLMSFGSDSAQYDSDHLNFLRNARSLNLGVAPLLHTMSIVHVRFRADMSIGAVSRIPHSLHPLTHSVYHYIDWQLRDVNAPALYAGRCDFFLRVNKITMPVDMGDRLAFRMLMGEEVLLMSYAVMFLAATLLKQMNRTEESPKMMRKATDLVLTTYGGDSEMCYALNELFKKFLGSSM